MPLAGMSVRRLGWLFVALELGALATVLVLKRFDGLDLEVYLGGARALAEHGTPYDVGIPTTHDILLPFTYPPFAAAAFLPAALLPFALAMRLISVLSIIAVGAVAYLFVAELNGALRDRADIRGHVIAATVGIGAQLAGAVLEPVRSTLGFGQINALLMAVVVLDALLPGRRRTRGLLIGLAAAVKLTPAVFVLLFLFGKDFKSATRAVLGFVGVGAAMWLAAPRASTEYWTKLVFDTGRIGGRDYVSNQSLRGLIARMGLAGSFENLLWVLGAAGVLGLTAFAMVRAFRAGQPTLALLACALGGLLISPVSWTHHWIWCVPILAVTGFLGGRVWKGDRPLACGLLGLALASALLFIIAPMWFAARPASSAGGWFATESYELLGLILLVAIALFAGRMGASSRRQRLALPIDDELDALREPGDVLRVDRREQTDA